MASATSPKRTLVFYSRLGLWLAVLIIAAGLAVQSLQINLFTQSTVDASFSQAMAEQIERAIVLRLQDTKDLQRAASQHTYTLNALQEGDATWLADLRNFLPGSQQVFVIDRDSAKNIHLDLGFTVQQLVNRTLKGADARLEAIESQGKRGFYWATPIYNDNKVEGVLLVEYGASWLAQLQQTISPNLGNTTLVQRFSAQDKSTELFNVGSKGNNTSLAVTLPINDIWFLSYTPNDERPQLALMPLTTPWIGVLLATLVVLGLLVFLQGREIRQNQFKLITFVRALTRQGGADLPKFSIRFFHELAISLASQVRPNVRGVSVENIRTDKPDLAIEPLRQRPYRVSTANTNEEMMVVEEVFNEDIEQNESNQNQRT